MKQKIVLSRAARCTTSGQPQHRLVMSVISTLDEAFLANRRAADAPVRESLSGNRRLEYRTPTILAGLRTLTQEIFSKSSFPLLLLALALGVTAAEGAPKPDLWPRWQVHNPESTATVDHRIWDDFLAKYVVTDHPSGVNRVRYAQVEPADKAALGRYIASLEAIPVSTLRRPEQLAYWINLYNALTVQVVLGHYPVESIRDIRSGWLTRGPWDLGLATVEGEEITLNDIEHRILRPIWKDSRVHYALNCASIGCPNLQAKAFTANTSERLLNDGAREYVNHGRGVSIEKGKMTLSSIYDWFQADFGGSERGVIAHLSTYANEELKRGLSEYRGAIRYRYDWSLNE